MTNDQILLCITILLIFVALIQGILLSQRDNQLALYEKMISKLIDDNVVLAKELQKNLQRNIKQNPFDEYEEDQSQKGA